ncbi:MAG: autotransporter outer membrane beta-barrel domain-containing protein, partial [Gammaproteobacteria bacterium]|nr:autotransporter outer membrane beta-barrel domain-containing protein [Gammaproteobacteria bacterium]
LGFEVDVSDETSSQALFNDYDRSTGVIGAGVRFKASEKLNAELGLTTNFSQKNEKDAYTISGNLRYKF